LLTIEAQDEEITISASEIIREFATYSPPSFLSGSAVWGVHSIVDALFLLKALQAFDINVTRTGNVLETDMTNERLNEIIALQRPA